MRWIALAGLAFALAGCGGEQAAPSPEQEVRTAFTELQAAMHKRQPGVLCAHYSAATSEALRQTYGRTCEELMNEALDDVPSLVRERQLRAGGVSLNASTALVKQQGGDGRMAFVREDGGWKLDNTELVAALNAATCAKQSRADVAASSNLRGVPARTVDELTRRICERGIQAGLLPRFGAITDEEAGALAAGVVQELRSERKLSPEVAERLLAT